MIQLYFLHILLAQVSQWPSNFAPEIKTKFKEFSVEI